LANTAKGENFPAEIDITPEKWRKFIVTVLNYGLFEIK
jgi:hypothetical protein